MKETISYKMRGITWTLTELLEDLLYGAESMKTTTSILNQIAVFQTGCLCRILCIFWPQTISNAELYKRMETTPLSKVIKRKEMEMDGGVPRYHPKGCDEKDTSREEKKWARSIETW